MFKLIKGHITNLYKKNSEIIFVDNNSTDNTTHAMVLSKIP